MATKLFKETDVWGDSSGQGDDLSFSFKKSKKSKEKKSKKQRFEDIEDDPNAGRFVRAPKYLDDEAQQETPTKKKKNKRKRKHEEITVAESSDQETPEKKPKVQNGTPEPLTYGEKLRESLKGSRFRFLNEQMYTQKGEDSLKMLQEDPTAFEAYHEGYRHQIAKWPMNPLDRIIKNIKKLPKNHVIVDMGCGDARLSKSVMQKVYSIDLVSKIPGVIQCDMAKTPLEANSAHVIVYCLSLMGTNLKDFFIEANRILKLNGQLKIAEVSSRFEDIKVFVDFVQKCGFDLINKDLSHDLFYFINFKKTHDVNSFNKKIPDYQLKPCLYKKR